MCQGPRARKGRSGDCDLVLADSKPPGFNHHGLWMTRSWLSLKSCYCFWLRGNRDLLLYKFFHDCWYPRKSEVSPQWTSQKGRECSSKPWRRKCHVEETFGEMYQLHTSKITAWDRAGEFQAIQKSGSRFLNEIKPWMPFQSTGRNQ